MARPFVARRVVGKRSNRQEVVYLPLALCATFLVMVCPVLLVWWLRDSGVVASAWVGTGIGMAVSFAVSALGAAVWKARTGSQDVLFSEVMLWGWLQRWRAERHLATATDVLGLRDGPRQKVSGGRLTHEQRADLLTQLASALEARDPYTHGHSRRVARHASNIAKRMGLPAAEVAKIRTAGVLHDIGKVETATALLQKEGKLTDEECEVVRRHSVDGATMVSALDDEELTAMVRHHHERFDGMGYPDRLAGLATPLGARIIAVADTFDAITSTRPYRQAHAHKKAIEILKSEAGRQLDPDAVRAFCSCYAGKRPLALWTIVFNGPPRFASWLGGGLSSAKAASVASVVAAATATTGMSGVALGRLDEAPTRSDRVAEATPAPAAAQRSSPSPVVRGEGGRPGARGKSQSQAEPRGGKAATRSRRARRKGRVPQRTTRSDATGAQDKQRDKIKSTKPGKGKGHDKPARSRGKRTGPGKSTGRGKAKPSPTAKRKRPVDRKGHPRKPDRTKGGRRPSRDPLLKDARGPADRCLTKPRPACEPSPNSSSPEKREKPG